MDPTRENAADESAHGPIHGLLRSLRNMIATVVALAHTRLELLSTELHQEVHRVAEIVLWTLVALLAAGMGLFMLALVVIFAFWDTHRLLAAGIVTSVFVGLAIGASVVLRVKIARKPRLLDATLAELAKDRDSLQRRS